jgi:phage FluMu protein Com
MKIICVLGVATVAMSLLWMPSAATAGRLAPEVTASEYPATLEGSESGAQSFSFEGGRTIECSGSSFNGTYTEAESKAEEASYVVAPSYSECSAKILGKSTTATVTANGCTYQLQPKRSMTGSLEGWEYSGTLSVKCPEGKKIEAHVFETPKSDEEGISLCTYTIAAQGPRDIVYFKTDESGEKVTAHAALTGLTVTRASGTTATCGAESQTGAYAGTAGVETIGSTLTGSLDASPPRMTMAAYPAKLYGKGTGKQRFLLPGGRFIECASTTFGGIYTKTESEMEQAGFTLAPKYSECTAEILGNVTPATITANGCTYKLNDEEAASGVPKEEGWAYSGSLTIKCPEGKKIEAHVFETNKKDEEKASLCTYAIGAQGPLKAIDYKTEEAGKKVRVNATLSSVAVSLTSGSTANCGTATQSASYTGNMTVEGKRRLTNSFDSAEKAILNKGGRVTAPEYPVTLGIIPEGVGLEFVTEGDRTFRCELATYATVVLSTKAEAEAGLMKLIPEYSLCSFTVGGTVTPATITMNGCYYTLTTGEKVGSVDIKCPEGKRIEVHVWSSAASHESNGATLCTYAIEEQGAVGALGDGFLDTNTYLVSGSTLSLTTKRTSGTVGNCGSESQIVQPRLEVRVAGANKVGEMVGLSLDE